LKINSNEATYVAILILPIDVNMIPCRTWTLIKQIEVRRSCSKKDHIVVKAIELDTICLERWGGIVSGINKVVDPDTYHEMDFIIS